MIFSIIIGMLDPRQNVIVLKKNICTSALKCYCIIKTREIQYEIQIIIPKGSLFTSGRTPINNIIYTAILYYCNNPINNAIYEALKSWDIVLSILYYCCVTWNFLAVNKHTLRVCACAAHGKTKYCNISLLPFPLTCKKTNTPLLKHLSCLRSVVNARSLSSPREIPTSNFA